MSYYSDSENYFYKVMQLIINISHFIHNTTQGIHLPLFCLALSEVPWTWRRCFNDISIDSAVCNSCFVFCVFHLWPVLCNCFIYLHFRLLCTGHYKKYLKSKCKFIWRLKPTWCYNIIISNIYLKFVIWYSKYFHVLVLLVNNL